VGIMFTLCCRTIFMAMLLVVMLLLKGRMNILHVLEPEK
jgi:hypothetical protein